MNGQFLGFVDLDSTLETLLAISGVDLDPIDPTVAPSCRIYQGSTLITTANLTKVNTGSITAATNASPIAITSAAHGLETGSRVIISGVLGNTAANGTFTITKTGVDAFTLDGSTGNGAYTSGGTWHVAGLYKLSVAALEISSFESGQTYSVLVSWLDGADPVTALHTFTVT